MHVLLIHLLSQQMALVPAVQLRFLNICHDDKSLCTLLVRKDVYMITFCVYMNKHGFQHTSAEQLGRAYKL